MKEAAKSNEYFDDIKKVEVTIKRLEREACGTINKVRKLFNSNQDVLEKISEFRRKRGNDKSYYEYFNQIPHRYACLRMAKYLLENKLVKKACINAGAENSRSKEWVPTPDITGYLGRKKILGEVFWVSESLFHQKIVKPKRNSRL